MHIHEATGQNDTTPEERHAARQAELAAALAEELDLDTDTVAAAVERVHERHRAEHRAALQERLDAAAEAGELTREQADAILAAREAAVLGRFGPRGHHWGPPVGSWPPQGCSPAPGGRLPRLSR
jgi:hypothetical protein